MRPLQLGLKWEIMQGDFWPEYHHCHVFYSIFKEYRLRAHVPSLSETSVSKKQYIKGRAGFNFEFSGF